MTIFGRDRPTRVGLLSATLAASLVAPGAGLVWPQINWDMLAYLGIVFSWHLPDAVAIQHAAYADMLRFAHSMHNDPAGQALVESSAYRRLMSSDAGAFLESFGFYRIRPLYLLLLATISRVTPTLAQATVVISAASVLAANLLMVGYAARRVTWAPSLLAALFFVLSPAQMVVAGYSTADALGTLVVLLGVLLMLRGQTVAGAAVLAVSVGVRTDFMVVNAAICVVFLWARALGLYRAPWGAVGLLMASVVVAHGIEVWAGNYGYRVLWYNTFVTIIPHPAHTGALAIAPHRWITAIIAGLCTGLGNGAFALPLLCALIFAGLCDYGDLKRMPGLLAVALLLGLTGRIILFPSPDVRLTAPIFAALWAVLIDVLDEKRVAFAAGSAARGGMA